MTKLAPRRAGDSRDHVGGLSRLVLSLPADLPVSHALDPSRLAPSDYSLLLKLVGSSSWSRALDCFHWLSLHRPHPLLLPSIISVLGRSSQSPFADRLFSLSSQPLPVQAYNSLMAVHAREGRYGRVRELLELMRSRGCAPDLVTFNVTINARAKAGRIGPGEPVGILEEVRRAGLRPDIITYNTLLAAAPSLEDAAAVYKVMRASGCRPDVRTYNAMVSVHGRRGRAADAERLLGEMHANGFEPDAVTYNSLVYAYAREGKVEEVERVCGEMCAVGLEKDEITYNTVIHLFGKQGMVDESLRFYGEMKDAGCRPDVVTYTVLIDCLGKAGRALDAMGIMSEMVESGVRPTLKMYSMLICTYAKAGMCEEAEKTFDVMVRSGVKPDNLVYSVVIDIVFRSGDMRKAMALYRDMVRDGCGLDEALHQVMLKAMEKDGRGEDVGALVCDMRELCGMSSRSICSVLVKAECFDHGANVLKESILQGGEVDNETLLSILNSFAATNKQEEASALLNFVREHAPNCQELVNEASIVMLCKHKHVEAAIQEYNQLTGFSHTALSTRSNLIETLISCCEESELFPEACQLFSEMRFHSIEPSLATYESMINIYCRMGFPETANNLLDQAMSVGLSFNDLSVQVTLIVEMYGKLKLLQKAEDLVVELRLQGAANRKIWNSLIYAYADSGLYEQARAVFNTMMKDGLSPSVDSVNGLIQALIVDGRLNEIYVVVQELQDMDFKISKSTILLMLDAFARVGNTFEVKKIYNGMKEAGYLPSMHLYRSMITMFCREKKVRDAETMLLEMEQVSLKPDLAIYNALIRMYNRIEYFTKVAYVHHKIQDAGLEKDEETYSSLILMYGKDRRPEEGLLLLNEMKRLGLEPKLEIYKSLLAACGKERLWEQAEDLFHEMQSKPYKLDRSVYHLMMKFYRESGNHSKAELLLSQMKDTGVLPSIATMHMLMDTYGKSGQPQEAENLLNNLKTSGLDLSTLPYSSVIDAYLKSGNYDMATKTLMDMKRDGVRPDHRIWTCFIRGASICSQTSEAMLLLNCLTDSGFDLPIRLLTEKSELLVRELGLLLDKIGAEDSAALNFVNALEDLLWAFERRSAASWIFQLAVTKGIYRHNVFRVADMDWGADFRKLSAGAALVGLTLWLDHMQDASLQGFPESPKSVALVTGAGEYHMVSLKKSLGIFLMEMGSPFRPCRTHTGLLVAKAHSLKMWLKDSSFCMDLELRDAPSLPKSNSIQLMEGYFMRDGLVPAFRDIRERLGQVNSKKFARLALMSDEKRDEAITADIEGRKEKLEKVKKRGEALQLRKSRRLRSGKFMRKHKNQLARG